MNNTTIVTALFDIGRGDIGGFSRDFSHYKECFSKVLEIEHPMLIFTTEDLNEFIYSIRDKENTVIINKTLDDLLSFPFIEQTNKIRNNPKWKEQSGWIPDSPQSALELYNPLVMSKQFYLNDATLMNPFNTKYFLWVDAGLSNTIGDPKKYFSKENVLKINKQMNKMLYLCFPYDGTVEVHGFEKNKLNELAGKTTDRVARGGIFGGTKHVINQINDVYYSLLNDTLLNGYMGTEESIFTLITYRNPELCNVYMIENNGLVIKFLEDINNQEVEEYDEEEFAFYLLTFNLPKQFNLWIQSIAKAYPEEFKKAKKYLINNSTDPKVDDEYQRLIKSHKFEEFKFDNIGICGGRQFAAEHFDKSGHKYMIFFEDDMLLHAETNKRCKLGFTTYQRDLLENCSYIMENENLDYLKLSFSEFYGDNHDNWAWFNVPEDVKNKIFPVNVDGRSPKKTKVFYTGSYKNLPYSVGEYHYCNWPIIFNKEGNRKVFLEDVFEHKYEQTWMSYVAQKQRDGDIIAGCLLASPINHNRVHHYNGQLRRENEHYKN